MSVARSRRELAAAELIQKAIRDGKVPSADEIVAALAAIDAVQPFDELDTTAVDFRNGVKISSDHLNKAIDIMEQELEGGIEALYDSWLTLEATLKTSETLVSQTDRADKIAGEAKRMLALTEYADAYRTASTVSLSDLGGIDLVHTDDVFVDTASKLMRLATTDITFKTFSISLGEVFESSNGTSRGFIEIGTPELVTRPGYGARHVLQVASTDPDDTIGVIYNVSLIADANTLPDEVRWQHAQDISIVEVDTNSAHDLHVQVEGTYDGVNWTELGQAWGNGKVTIVGSAQKATDLRITLRKVKHDSVGSSSSLRYAYIFDTGQVRVGIACYEPSGTLYTNTMELSDSGITSVTIDANVNKPNGTNVLMYVASDSEDADPDTLQWTKVQPGKVLDIVTRRTFARVVHVDDAPKYLLGAGSLHDLWIVDTGAEKLVSLDAGINQARVRATNDTLSSVILAPTTAASAALITNPIVDLNHDISLSGHTIYRLEFSVWADTAGSASIGLRSGTPSNTIIVVNGADVTKSWLRDEVSVGLSQGENKIVVLVGSATTTWVNITPPDGLLSALERPVVKDYTQISDGTSAVAQKDTKIISNFDPSGMVVQVTVSEEDGARSAGSIRAKFVLETSDPFVTPTVSDIYIVAGV